MFDELTLDGLRGTGRVELKFQPGSRVRTLFGANGVGKTKCLEAIYQALVMTNKQACAYKSRLLIPDRCFLAENMAFSPKNIPPLPAALKAGGYWLEAQPLHSMPVLFIGAQARASMNAVDHENLAALGSFEKRQLAYFEKIANFLCEENLLTLHMDGNVQQWLVRRAQTVNPYQKAQDNFKHEIHAVLRMLHAFDDSIDAETMQIDASERVHLKIGNQFRALDELSSGFASLVKLIQAIVAGYAHFINTPNLHEVSGIVLIDEIESHLHASWQARIIPTLKRLLPNTIFYVATHSPIVLSQLEEGEAYLLRRDADGVVRSSMIDSPDRRAFADVLDDALNVNLNVLKRHRMENSDQHHAKRQLLKLMQQPHSGVDS